MKTRNARIFTALVLVFLVALFLGSPAPRAESRTIADINAAIGAAGAGWVAAENPIYLKSPEERRKLLGALEEAAGPDAEEPGALAPFAAVPTSYDWRNVGGYNYVTPVKNQNPCGSCFVFGPVAALESKYLIYNGLGGVNIDLSEQIVLSCSTAGDCSGGYASTASDYLKNTGTAVESCYPYTATKGPCANACANWQDDAYTISSWAYVNSGEVATSAEIKQAIYDYGPVVVWFKVYDDFYGYSSGVYSKTAGSTYEGNHFVLVVGWNDSQSAFICKNSWASTWGDGGYFRINYSQLAGDVQFGYWTYRYGNGYGPSIDWYDAYRVIFSSPQDLALFRAYRDSVMSDTAFGTFCSGIIYNQSEELLKVLLRHPRLLIQARRLVRANRAAVQEVVAGAYGTIENTDDVLAFIDDVAAYSPLSLKMFLYQVANQMQNHRSQGEPFLGFILN